ncbi:MAG: hypothetical protein AAF745_02765, partial [Planctomycetota bacterium]
AARRPSNTPRLLAAYNEVVSLQPLVEQRVFGSGCPKIAAALGPCWNEVVSISGLLQLRMSPYQSFQTSVPTDFGLSAPPTCPPINSTLPSPSPLTSAMPPWQTQREPIERFRGESDGRTAALLRTILLNAFR